MKPVRWGIIGCGDVTEIKSGPGLRKAEGSELIAVMRRNGTLAADYARRHGVPRSHDDADMIIRAPDIDAVYVATMPESHCDYVLRCAAAGKPVLVEKPMAMDHGQCMRMIQACSAARVPLWVAYYRRALPRFLAVRDLLASGAIGPVRMVTSRQFQPALAAAGPADGDAPAWRVDAALSGGGHFVDMMSHTLDFFDLLFGPVERVRAFAGNQGGNYRVEDIVAASFRFTSGVLGSGAWCYAADREEEFNEIVGSKGRIRFSTTRPVPIQLSRDGGVEEIAVEDPPHVHQPLIQTMVDELNGNGKCPSNGQSAARTTWVIDEILREFRTGAGRDAR